jgi:hypothetical protein
MRAHAQTYVRAHARHAVFLGPAVRPAQRLRLSIRGGRAARALPLAHATRRSARPRARGERGPDDGGETGPAGAPPTAHTGDAPCPLPGQIVDSALPRPRRSPRRRPRPTRKCHPHGQSPPDAPSDCSSLHATDVQIADAPIGGVNHRESARAIRRGRWWPRVFRPRLLLISHAVTFCCQKAISPPAGVATTLRQPAGPSRGSSSTVAPSSAAWAVACSTRSTST